MSFNKLKTNQFPTMSKAYAIMDAIQLSIKKALPDSNHNSTVCIETSIWTEEELEKLKKQLLTEFNSPVNNQPTTIKS